MSRCPIPGCKVDVASDMFACKRHWFSLPKYIRDEIWASYRDGIRKRTHPTKRWRMAAHNAMEYLRDKAGPNIKLTPPDKPEKPQDQQPDLFPFQRKGDHA